MFIGEAVLVDSCDVGSGAIADMFVETVCGIFGRDFSHVVVASDFGNDGGGRNLTNFVVAFDTGRSIVFQGGVA